MSFQSHRHLGTKLPLCVTIPPPHLSVELLSLKTQRGNFVLKRVSNLDCQSLMLASTDLLKVSFCLQPLTLEIVHEYGQEKQLQRPKI